MTLDYSCDYNKYTLRYLRRLGELRKDIPPVSNDNSAGEEDDSNGSEMDDEDLMLMG